MLGRVRDVREGPDGIVAFVRLVLRGLTDGAVRGAGGALAVAGDSIAASVELRNAD